MLIACVGAAVWLGVVLVVVGLCRHAARGDRAIHDLQGDLHGGDRRAPDASAAAGLARPIPSAGVRQRADRGRAGVR